MDGQIIRCPRCGKANRLPSLESGKKAVCGNCKAPLEGGASSGGKPVTLTDATFEQAISKGAHIVDFWAPWCGPCRMIAPILDELAAERGDLTIGKLNVDENPRTAEDYDVRGIPLLIFFVDGQAKGRVVGAVPRGEIEAAIQRYFGQAG